LSCYEYRELDDIATALGLTEYQVDQMHATALDALRTRLAASLRHSWKVALDKRLPGALREPKENWKEISEHVREELFNHDISPAQRGFVTLFAKATGI